MEALIAAALLGMLMATLINSGIRIRWAAALHGLVGAAGWVLLLRGLRGPLRGVAQGASSFGFVAAVFVAAALALGLLMLAGALRRWRPGVLVIGMHATLAVIGVVMLAAYLSV